MASRREAECPARVPEGDGRRRRLLRRCLRRRRLGLIVVPALLVCVLGGTAGANAASFGGRGAGAGEFFEPHGIAMNQETGELFLADRNNNRIDVFARSGAFLRSFGWGVASNAEELQTCTSQCFSGFAGHGSGELSSPEGIAVDNDPLSLSHGDVYVWDRSNLRVQKFSPSGEFILMFGGEVNATTKGDVCLAEEACKAGVEGATPGRFQQTAGNSVTVDEAGAVYFGDKDRVQEFNPSGALEAVVPLAGAGAIEQLGIDAAKHLYVKSKSLLGVRKYDLTGKEIGAPRDSSGAPGPLALAGETLYLSDGAGAGHILRFGAEGEQQKGFGAGVPAGNGLVFDQTSDAIFALSPTAVTVAPVPPNGPLVVSQSVSAIQPTGATLGALVNPESPQATSYHFEYGPTAAYGTSTPPTALGGKPFEDQSASAAISGLAPNGTYHFRVVVTNAASETSVGPDQSFTAASPVGIDSESVTAVTGFSAQLQAQLNPHGSPTEYRFEYGATAAYGQDAPIPDASAGQGVEDATVAIPIQGLEAETTYHYRIVAHNGFGESVGADHVFTTQGSATAPLIDGRAWEMVSPLDKQGVTFEAISKEGAVIDAGEAGAAITYAAKAPITKEPEGNRAIANSQVLSKRTAPGSWATQDIATRHEEVAGLAPGDPSEYKLFSSNLETAVVEPHGATSLVPTETEPKQERTPYRREADGSYTPLVNAANVQPGVKYGGEEFSVGGFGFSPDLITATPDGSHVLLSSPQGLVPGVEFVENEVQNIYEWSGGRLTLVSVLPNGTPSSHEGDNVFAGASNTLVRNAISADGDRVTFEARSHNGTHLYQRDVALGKTVKLDAAQPGVKEGGEGGPIFQDASGDGSRVFFLDVANLTADAKARQSQPDLYECEVSAPAGAPQCTLRDLSADPNVGESANVLGVLGADETGRYVYFVADGRLAPGAVAGNCPDNLTLEGSSDAQSCNLYVRDTESGSTRLVAVLSGRDFRSWEPAGGSALDLGGLTARVSPNGQYLAFMSQRSLTGFDNRDAKSGERDQEVFEYGLSANTLTCVSCASSGARPDGVLDPGGFPGLLVDRPTLWEGRWLAGSIPGWTRVNTTHALYQSRYLSNSGRLLFNSATQLVPSDANGLEDVYEYEPSDAGGCTLSSGCVGLISSGGSSEEAAFIDASADGSDVFFLTSARLAGSDTDNAYDVYDAHLCSGASPCPPPAAATPPPCSTADACRAAPPPQPDIFGAPASQTFSGLGNPVASTPAAKPKPLTPAQKLANALKACKKDRNRKKRIACERSARKRYAPQKKHAKGTKGGSGR